VGQCPNVAKATVLDEKGCLDTDAQTDWNVVMATTLLAMLPPALLIIFMQRWFVKGMVDSEK
jgi:sn-glycerol 3-phosphate transport system permease protein